MGSLVKSGSKVRKVLSFPLASFLSFFFFLPLLAIVPKGLGAISSTIFLDPFTWHVIRFTYLQAFLSSLLSVLFGFVLALMVVEWEVWGSKFIWRLSLLCSSLPPLIVALAILGASGPDSVLSKVFFLEKSLFGWSGILWGHVFLNFAIPLRLIGTSLMERNKTAELTALTLGMPRIKVFTKCIWPEIRLSIASSGLLAFLYSSSSLFIVLFLGGSPKFTTLEVFLYEAVKLNFDWGKALEIACLQVLLGGAIFMAYLKLQLKRRIQREWVEVKVLSPRKQITKVVGSLVLWGFIIVGVLLPLGTVLRDGLMNIKSVDPKDLVDSLFTSLSIAFWVTGLSLALLYPYLHVLYGGKSPRKEKLGLAIVTIPQFFSSLLVALVLSAFFPVFRENISFSFIGIILTQTLFVIPLISFPLKEGFLRMSQERLWVAKSLGANRWQCWKNVEFPAMKRPVILAMLLAVSFSLGEVSSVLLFSPQGIRPLSLSIFQAMSRYRFQEAHALTMFLLLVIGTILWGVSCLEEKNEKPHR